MSGSCARAARLWLSALQALPPQVLLCSASWGGGGWGGRGRCLEGRAVTLVPSKLGLGDAGVKLSECNGTSESCSTGWECVQIIDFPRVTLPLSLGFGLHRNGNSSEMLTRFNAGGDCGPSSLRQRGRDVWLRGALETDE